MSDLQTSVVLSFGRVMIDCFGGFDPLRIVVRGKAILFEMSEEFGPMPVTGRGAERDLGARHPFWRAVSLWNVQGRRREGDIAIWHEPKKPVLEHLGGRNYREIEAGETGWDW
jgi:hypothetical protein